MDVEMAIASNQLERSLSKWTVIGSILIPWTLVSGYFGMNVKVPGNDVDTLDWWWIIMGSMAAYTLLTLATAKYNRLF
jgi:magnesium transporter